MTIRRFTERDDRTLQGNPDGGWRDPDRHVSFLWEARLEGGHVHVKVRAASRHPSVQVNHSRGLAGELVLRPDEWLLLERALRHANECTMARSSEPRLRYWDGSFGQCVAPAGFGYEPEGPDHDGQVFMEITEEGIS